MARKPFVVLFALSLLLLLGCKEEPLQEVEQRVVEPVEKAPLTVTSAPEREAPVAEQAPEEQPAEPEQEEPFCGDGVCSGAENCDRCVKDCGCTSPAECYQGRCKVPECGADTECKDNDTCTIDICQFAQHPNAYCSHEVITKFRNNDKCCPRGGDANTDTDCEPECGNNVCEPGETSSNCEKDCEEEPECGNGECEEGETEENCREDCYQPVCGNGDCEEGETSENCYEDCM